MAHLVVCAICGRQFDRDKEQAVKHNGRRYSHYECEPDKELVPLLIKPDVDPALTALKDYIKLKYGAKANWALINKQIKTFHDEKGYSYSGMLKSLTYFLDIKKNTIEKSNGGIGIIEYCYQAAYDYYLAIFLAQQNSNVEYKQTTKEYVIPLPKARGIKNRLLEWSIEDEE